MRPHLARPFASAFRVFALLLPLAAWAAAAAPYTYQRVGKPTNIAAHPTAGFALMGGGTDLDQAFQWMCARSDDGDFLVLRASGTDAYNPYIQKLCPQENSVATLILPSRVAAQDPFAAQAIRAASAIFIAGGDQSNYINFWQNTPVQRELQDAIHRGVPLGGTSAGLAVLAEYAYSAQNDKPGGSDLTSAAALANPFHPQVVLVRNFLRIRPLRGVVTDTHFHARGREGRLLVFLARILQSGEARTIHGLGVDQHTALLVDGEGRAMTAGTGAVYALTASGRPLLCQVNAPLSMDNIAVVRLTAGQVFDLAAWRGQGTSYTLAVQAGAVTSTQPGGSPY